MPRSGRIGWMLATGLIVLVLVGGAGAQSSTTNPYRATFGWEQLPEGARDGDGERRLPGPPTGVTSGFWTGAAPTSARAPTSTRS